MKSWRNTKMKHLLLIIISLLPSFLYAENRYQNEINVLTKAHEAYKISGKETLIYFEKVKIIYKIIDNKSKVIDEVLGRYAKSKNRKTENISEKWILEKFYSEELEQELIEIISYIGFSVDFLQSAKSSNNPHSLDDLKKLYEEYDLLRRKYKDKKETAIRQIKILNENFKVSVSRKRYNKKIQNQVMNGLSSIQGEIQKTVFFVKYALKLNTVEKLMFYKAKLGGLRYMNHRFLKLGLLKNPGSVRFYEQIEDGISKAFELVNEKLYGLIPEANKYTRIKLQVSDLGRMIAVSMADMNRADRDAIDRGTSLRESLDRLNDRYRDPEGRNNSGNNSNRSEQKNDPYQKHPTQTGKRSTLFNIKKEDGTFETKQYEVKFSFNSEAEKQKKIFEIDREYNKELPTKTIEIEGQTFTVIAVERVKSTHRTFEVIPIPQDVQNADNIVNNPEKNEKLQKDTDMLDRRLESIRGEEKDYRHKQDLGGLVNASKPLKKAVDEFSKKLKGIIGGIAGYANKISNNIKNIRKGMSAPEIQALDSLDMVIGTVPIVDIAWDSINFLSVVAIDHSLTGAEAKDAASKVIYGLGPFIPLVSGGLAVKGAREAGKIYKYLEKGQIDNKVLKEVIGFYSSSKSSIESLLKKSSKLIEKAKVVLKDETGVMHIEFKKLSLKAGAAITAGSYTLRRIIHYIQGNEMSENITDTMIEIRKFKQLNPDKSKECDHAISDLRLLNIQVVNKTLNRTIIEYPNIFNLLSKSGYKREIKETLKLLLSDNYQLELKKINDIKSGMEERNE
jgi:hypothetical protein